LGFNSDRPNLLISGGFHGEEIAGPWAILKFLETAFTDLLDKANLTFLPCVNPIGFNRGTRYARAGERTNAGFCHEEETGDKLSTEGQILMENIDFLIKSASGGFLSLHEDDTVDKFYIYSFEHTLKPGRFTIAMRDEEAKYFEVLPDGIEVNEEGDPESIVEQGIVYRLCDGSFEDMLFHRGVSRTLVIETPAKSIALEKRVEVGVALIMKFINLSKRWR
jgi:hypothetical protein